MAKKISSSDLFEQEDIFIGLRKSADQAIAKLEKLEMSLKDIAKVTEPLIKNANFGSTQGINQFTEATKKAEKTSKDFISVEREKQELIKARAIADQQLIKVQQEKERLEQQQIRTTTAKQQADAKANKEAEKGAKVARDEANAYKQLEKNTRDLKNQSKQLGAELLHLEQTGRKNTAEYRKLSAQYQQVTASAQRGDAQLKKLDKSVGDNFRNVGNYQSALGKLNSVLGAVGLSFGVSVAIRQTKQLITDSIDAFRIQEKAVKQVETGLVSTNNKVGLSLQQLKDEASALQKQTLFGDEAILKDVTSILLTFTNIQGETFKSAQKNVLDLATRMDGDLKGASVQLGKALNDPIKGITALTKVGVSFTEQQKEQVKTLVESGRLQEAQALILNELNTEFGGSAEAAAKADGGFTQLQNSIGDAKEMIGSIIVDRLKPLNKELLEFFSNLTQEDIKKFVDTLSTLGSIIFKVTTAYVTYKGVLIALNVIERIRSTNFKDLGNQMMRQIPLTKQYAKAQEELANNQKQGANVTKGLGSALAGVGWTIAIGVAIELATAFYDVASGAKAAREAQQMLDTYNAEAEKKADKRVGQRQKDLNKTLAELQRQRNENKLTEKQFLEQKRKEIQATQKSIKTDINSVKNRKEGYKSEIKEIQTLMKAMQGGFLFRTATDEQALEFAKRFKGNSEEAEREISRLRASISATDEKIRIYGEELDGVTESQKDATSEIKVNSIAHEDNTKKITAKIPKQKEINTEFKKYNEYLSRQTELLEQINQIEADRQINAIEKQIEKEVELQTKQADETKQYDLTRFNELVNEKYQLQVDAILKQNDFEQEQNQLKYDRDKAERQAQLDEEYQSLIDGADGNQKAINEINENYKIRKQQLADDELKIEKDLQTQNLIIQKNTTDEIEKLQQDKLDLIEDTNAELLDKTKVEAKDEIDVLKKAEEEKRALIKMTSDFFIGQSEKRIAKIDEEINKATQQYEHLKGLAESGNIDAQQSLAEQQKIIDDANLRKQRELKKQQRIKLAESVYSTYSQKVESGSKNPLAETIRDTTLLNQFINSLPAFESGTENTGANGRGVDGKGGFHAILHPNERVIPKSLNEQIGAMSNEDLARIAQEHQNNKNFGGNYQSGTSLELALLVNEIKDLKTIIKDKPETNIELGEITTGAMEIVKSVRQGNTTTYNRYKIK